MTKSAFTTVTLKIDERDVSIVLRPPVHRDLAAIYRWHTDLQTLHLWLQDRRMLSEDEFARAFPETLRHRIVFFVIALRENLNKAAKGVETDDVAVGMFYTYNHNMVDRHAYLAAYLDPQYTHKGIAIAAGRILGDYLFNIYNLRKLYAEIFAYNYPALKAASKAGFVEEGRLKRHRWHQGQYWDLVILALYREAFLHSLSPEPRKG